MYSLSPQKEKYASTFNRRMDDMNCIVDTSAGGSVYLGNFESASDPDNLNRHRINGVLSICMNKLPYEVSSSLNNYHHIYLEDAESENISRYFDQTYNFIERARQNGNVLVHCMAGISRSATILAAYLMKKNKMSARDAVSHLERRRWQVYPNDGFLRQLQQYEKHVLGSADSSTYWYKNNANSFSKTLYQTPNKADSEYLQVRNKYLSDEPLTVQKSRPLDFSIDKYRKSLSSNKKEYQTPSPTRHSIGTLFDTLTPEKKVSETHHKPVFSMDLQKRSATKQDQYNGLSYIALDQNQRNFDSKRFDFDNKFTARPVNSYLSNNFQMNASTKVGFSPHMSKLDQLLNSFNNRKQLVQ